MYGSHVSHKCVLALAFVLIILAVQRIVGVIGKVRFVDNCINVKILNSSMRYNCCINAIKHIFSEHNDL